MDVWWKHSPSRVCENNFCKLLWDFSLVTDASLRHDCSDITTILKQTNEAYVYLIDITIPRDSRLTQKVVEKQTKYMDLKLPEFGIAGECLSFQ